MTWQWTSTLEYKNDIFIPDSHSSYLQLLGSTLYIKDFAENFSKTLTLLLSLSTFYFDNLLLYFFLFLINVISLNKVKIKIFVNNERQ